MLNYAFTRDFWVAAVGSMVCELIVESKSYDDVRKKHLRLST